MTQTTFIWDLADYNTSRTLFGRTVDTAIRRIRAIPVRTTDPEGEVVPLVLRKRETTAVRGRPLTMDGKLFTVPMRSTRQELAQLHRIEQQCRTFVMNNRREIGIPDLKPSRVFVAFRDDDRTVVLKYHSDSCKSYDADGDEIDLAVVTQSFRVDHTFSIPRLLVFQDTVVIDCVAVECAISDVGWLEREEIQSMRKAIAETVVTKGAKRRRRN